jgi:hypothetical protein
VDDVESVAGGGAGGAGSPGAALVFHLDPYGAVRVELGADGEFSAGLPGLAVPDRVGGQFRGAQADIIGKRMAAE